MKVLFMLVLVQVADLFLPVLSYYIDDGYQTSFQLMDAEDQRQVQQDMLGVLGFQEAPKLRHIDLDSPAAHYMRSLYARLQKEQEDSVNEEQLVHLRDAQDGPSDLVLQQLQKADMVASFDNSLRHSENRHHDRFHFDFTRMEPGEVLSAAELRLYHVTSDLRTQALQVKLFAEQKDGSLESKAEVITTVSPRAEGWISLNVTRITMMWWNDAAINHGFRLVITDDQGKVIGARKAGFASKSDSQWHKPFLIGYLTTPQEVEVSRQRRAASRSRSRKPKTSYHGSVVEQWRTVSCQKRELYVDFKELNMDSFVISPQGFYTNFCSGKCSFPLDSHLNASNHAIIQTLVKTLSNDNYPAPCCVPVTLGAISMLYFREKQEVVIKKYKNMVVKTCGCR